MREKYEPIAIVGMGLRFPGGNTDVPGFTEFLRAGKSGIRPLPDDRRHLDPDPGGASDRDRPVGGFLDGIDRFDAAFFNISPKEAVYIDPHQRLALETAWEALEHAGMDPAALRHSTSGVFMGVTTLDYIFEATDLDPADVDGYLAPGLSHSGVSGRLSYFLGLRGPCLTVDTTCSSSLAAAHLAVQALRNGECGLALCGGVNVIHNALGNSVLQAGNMLAPDGQCKSFDDSADGYGRAEGCGVLVLKRLSDARRDGDTVHAVISGSAVGQDGESAGLAAPNGAAQEAVLRASLASARLEPADIQYVEAHGTGTALGDPTEMGAISDVFAESHSPSAPVVVGSLKTNIGHMEGAAGVGGIIKAALQLREGTIFPHLNFVNPSRRIAWATAPVTIPTEARPWPAAETRRALVNGFGVTGTLASVVVEQAPADTPAVAEAPAVTGTPALTETDATQPQGGVFTLSAKNRKSLRAQAERYKEFLELDPGQPVADLCRTANTGRAHFKYRIAAPVREHRDITRLLDKHLEQADAQATTGVPKVALLFTGMGSQYTGMGAALYRQYPVFRDALDECDRLFAPLLGLSLKDLMLGESESESQGESQGEGEGEAPGLIDQARYAQPAVFSLEYALAQLWLSWGLRPSVLIGHSLGEVAAAAVAGLFSLEDAARLVAERGRLSQSVTVPGGMAAVGAPARDIAPLLEPYPDLGIGAINGPTQCLVSGGRDALTALGEVLAEKGVKFTVLPSAVPYHSPLLSGILDDFRAVLETISFRTPNMTLVSNVTGQVAKAAEIATPDYWVRHLVAPVDFEAGIAAVEKRGRHAFVEVGPSGALTSLARNCAADPGHLWLSSTYRGDQDAERVRRSLAQLYSAGLPVSWTGYHRGRPGRKADLPAYAFDRKPYWLPTPQRRQAEEAWRAERTPEAEREKDRHLFYEAHWDRQPLPDTRRGTRHVLALGGTAERYPHLVASAADAGVRLTFAASAGDLAALLRDEPPTDLCWFWRGDLGAPDGPGGTEAERLRAESEANYRELLDVLGTLGEVRFGRNQRLWLITEGAQQLPGDAPGDRVPAASTLWGFGRALAVECPGYQVTLVDLPADGTGHEALVGEWLSAGDAEAQLAHRGQERWVRRLRRAEPGDRPRREKPVTIRPDRTYVVVGGLGALGLTTARRLVGLGARHLALLTRTGASAEELAALKLGEGVQVTAPRCDIGSAEDVVRVTAALAEGGHPVGGIVHAAGTVADIPVADQTWESIDTVFRTKVFGAWLLHEATVSMPELDFFVGYSTAASVLGATTQTNSCAGNAFLDHLMAWRDARGLPSLSVGWGPWAAVDPARKLSSSLVRSWEGQGITFLEPVEAMEALPTLLEREGAHIMAGACDWERFIARRPENALYTELRTNGAGADGGGAALDLATLLAASGQERLNAINATVRARISDVLQFAAEDVEPDAELADLGLDSLNAVELKNALESTFRVTLPVSIAFDQPSVNLLADYIDRLLGPGLEEAA
ncbi:SDR family NAD(P)-dependent oxidoreductase [Streptomyces sp. C36]|uniref:type I polyketide synthase n=1 Tax=Streptomyces sp. C36 TaxID=3237122 RepID=UPI0034C6266B